MREEGRGPPACLNSVLHLLVVKGQGLWSGILSSTSLVLPPKVKCVICFITHYSLKAQFFTLPPSNSWLTNALSSHKPRAKCLRKQAMNFFCKDNCKKKRILFLAFYFTSLFPQSTLIVYRRGLFEENPLMKIVGSPWKEGEIRLEVDKKFNRVKSATHSVFIACFALYDVFKKY